MFRQLTLGSLVALTLTTAVQADPRADEMVHLPTRPIWNPGRPIRIPPILLGTGSIGGACPSNISWVYSQVPQLNAYLYDEAKSHLGQEVGSGECADIPGEFIPQGGGEPFYDLGPSGDNQDYVWGDYVGTVTTSHKDIRPAVAGDVLQMRNVVIKTYGPGGSWSQFSYPHHTAVVSAVSADGTKACVLQQNINGNRTVQYGYFDLTGLQSGWIKIYGPKHR